MSKYEIEKNPIWLDIKNIFGSGKKDVKFEYRIMVHTEKQDFPVIKITSFDVKRDYFNNVGDHVEIEFKLGLGDYMVRLYPFRNNLELTVKKILLEESSDRKQNNSKISTQRYKAIFLADKNPELSATDIESADIESLNRGSIIDVKLQLVDRSLEPLRVKTVYGVFKDYTPKELIHGLLGGESLKVQVDGKPSIDGINLIDPDNKDKRKHSIFPNGTLITTIPTYIQEKMGGVYNAGVGTYLQTYKDKKLWFVFPIYNYTRFDSTKDDKCIIYAVPQERLTGIDRTFKQEGTILKIIATGTKNYYDTADIDYMNEGSGFRVADPRTFMKKPAIVHEEGPKGRRVQVNTEFGIEQRDDGLNYAPVINTGASCNLFKYTSDVSSRKVSKIDLIWENSDPDLIYPGMLCKYIFLDNNKPLELRGTIVFCQSTTMLQSNTIEGKTYKTVSAITLLAEEKYTVRKLPISKPYGKF